MYLIQQTLYAQLTGPAFHYILLKSLDSFTTVDALVAGILRLALDKIKIKQLTLNIAVLFL